MLASSCVVPVSTEAWYKEPRSAKYTEGYNDFEENCRTLWFYCRSLLSLINVFVSHRIFVMRLNDHDVFSDLFCKQGTGSKRTRTQLILTRAYKLHSNLEKKENYNKDHEKIFWKKIGTLDPTEHYRISFLRNKILGNTDDIYLQQILCDTLLPCSRLNLRQRIVVGSLG